SALPCPRPDPEGRGVGSRPGRGGGRGGGAGGCRPAVTAARGAAAVPVRLMLVGDSITHGSAGDYTWRYFLDRHLRAAGRPVDLVGPRRDLFDQGSGTSGSRAYADPDFDQDHASQWGNALVWPRLSIRDAATEHRPDVVVLALGT